MNARQRHHASIAFIISAAFTIFAMLAAVRYVVSLAQQQLDSETANVKQSFFESIKSVETVAENLQSLIAAVGDESEPNFQEFTAQVLDNYNFINAVNYYTRVEKHSRAAYENHLKKLGKGDGLVETVADSPNEVRPAPVRDLYFPLTLADTKASEHSYYGWDLLSDSGKKEAVLAAIDLQKLIASESYLLESGHAAFDLFAPVMIEGRLKGVIGMTIDIPRLLGDEQWRRNVTVMLGTMLTGERTRKDLYRALDQSPDPTVTLATLNSITEVTNFGQTLGLKFERVLGLSRLNSGILAMVLLACLVLGLLAIYLATTLANLANSLNELAKVNAGLEKTVAERTKNLSEVNHEIADMLENLDDAVFTVGADLKIQARYSPATAKILGSDSIAGADVRELLYKNLDRASDQYAAHFTTLKLMFGSDDFQWEMTNSNLERSVLYDRVADDKTVSQRILSVRYAPLYENMVIKKILFVSSDITEILALRRAVNEDQRVASEKANIVSEILEADRQTLVTFMEESLDRMKALNEAAGELEKTRSDRVGEALFRELHTMKGNARAAHLFGISQVVHLLEDDFQLLKDKLKTVSQDEIEKFKQGLKELNLIAKKYRDVFMEIFGAKDSQGDGDTMIRMAIRQLRSGSDVETLAVALQAQIDSKTILLSDLAASFASMIRDLSKQLGKDVDPIVTLGELCLDRELGRPLRDVLTHLIRNSLDHGIERPELRKAAGKTMVGHLQLHYRVKETAVHLTISDDGAGVDTSRVLNLAIAKNLPGAEAGDLKDSDILEFLFHPGFSTKEGVSDWSGRGVGLDAVRETVLGFGGRVSVHSVRGQGTSFEIVLPLERVKFAEVNTKLLIIDRDRGPSYNRQLIKII